MPIIRSMRPIDNERGVIFNWLVKLALGLAIAGVILFDAGAIAVNLFGLDSTARDIAIAISTSAGTGSSEVEIEQEAEEMAKAAGARLLRVELDTQANTVEVRLRRRAKTVIVSRVEPIMDWGKATAVGKAGTR